MSHVDDGGCTGRQRAALDAAPHDGQAPQVRVKRDRLYASTSDHARKRMAGLRGMSASSTLQRTTLQNKPAAG